MQKLRYPGGQVDRDRVASMDVDVQNGFTLVCPDELPVPEGDEIAPELNLQAAFARYRAMSQDMHPPGAVWEASEEHPQLEPVEGYPNVDIRWTTHCVSGTKGSQLIAGLPHPSEYDFWAIKGTQGDMHPYGACYQDLENKISTGLIEWLQAKGVSTVIVGGLATEFCVLQTALQLLDAGFTVILNLGAIRGIFPDMVSAAIDEMREKGAIVIDSARQLQLA